MLRKNIILLFIATLFIMNEYSFINAKELSEMDAKKIAKEAIENVGGKLKHTLMQKVKTGGFANAADFCSTEAGKLAKEASKSLPNGVSVQRITNKPRNSLNKATLDHLKVLSSIDAELKKGNTPQMIVKKLSANHYQVYKPLIMAGKCLNCHGDNSTRNKEAYKIIQAKYPNDKAIGYKKGELRGAFLVDIKR